MRLTWLGIGLVGCGVEPGVEEVAIDEADLALADELEREVARYVEALVADDVEAVRGMASSELLARGEQRGISFERFVEKQRNAMNRTFSLEEGTIPAFEVTSAVVEGSAVRVSLALDGEDLPKPFYFVDEGGELKLSIAVPGFSKAAPDGAAFGTDSYRVRNLNAASAGGTTMLCLDGSTTVMPGTYRQVSCTNTCGWWSGSLFQAQGFYSPVRECDWNSWGDDVVISFGLSYGWDCNDYCW